MPVITVALQTLRKIDAMVAADQGSAYRGWLGKVMPHIGDAYRTDEDAHRSHLGASVLGRECGREIWYKFRWTTKRGFDGRMLRLFNRGHIEEARFIALLLMIGCEVFQQDADGKQYRISFADQHGGGSGDGVLLGVPDVPTGTALLGEFKTHGDKSFIELAGKLDEWRSYVAGKGPFTGKGVRDAKFEHFVQMQLYMRKMGLPAGLYVAVNKNTDDLYAEVVMLDSIIADQFLERGETLVWAMTPPKKINASPGFFKCRFCDERPVCHLGATPDVNCRTCRFSAPVAGGQWICTNEVAPGPIDKATQLRGCSHYEVNRAFNDT